MTPAAAHRIVEIASACGRRIEAGQEYIALTLAAKPGRGRRMRLAGPRSPLGEILNWTERGTICLFKALDVLAWCCAQGCVRVEGKGE